MTHWKKIFIVLLPTVVSYLLVSKLLSGFQFDLFDVGWRIAIIVTIYVATKVRFNFSARQWILFTIFLLLETVLYNLLSSGMSPIRIAISIVLAPLAEELLFRGWIMSQLQGSIHKKIILSSILFSLYHLKNAFVLTSTALISQLFFAGIVAGPILGWVRLKYGSLFPAVLLHGGAFNAFADTMTSKLLPVIVKRNQEFSE